MSKVLVLGSGIVGTAATWDLDRRGHEVTVADLDPDRATGVAARHGGTPLGLDATDTAAVRRALDGHDVVINAVSYRLGFDLAAAAVATGTHYLDFGGNPSVVARQLTLDADARAAGVAVVPDCGLAPGYANVLAEEVIARLGGGDLDEVQIRVGALPQQPVGVLGYQLAFSPEGLINEYVEPCEVLEEGRPIEVEPLDRFETVEWGPLGALEAFSTAGGTSTMCRLHAGEVRTLEYKTLRYPGHGKAFRAMYEVGLLYHDPVAVEGRPVSPRKVLEALLAERLPRGGPDLVLVRVWGRRGADITGWEVTDRHDGVFSALARTTAFPATAAVDLVLAGTVDAGAAAMHAAVPPGPLIADLDDLGISPRPWPGDQAG